MPGGYLLHLPDGYDADPSVRWPLVLFLHGAGERGDDLRRVASHGPPRRVAEGERFPFVLVAPQVPAGASWTVERVRAAYDDATSRHRVDPDRVYVTGLSMGGFGTWAFATAYPELVAAVAPVCGGGDSAQACRMAEVPAWAFHGARDAVVPPAYSEAMVAALRACGAAPRFTLYPDAGHDSWTETYANPVLYDWLLSHRLSDRA